MDRLTLKSNLMWSRGRCAVCGKEFTDLSVDMHEALLTRGNALHSAADIMVPQNCVLVHHGECHIRAQTVAGRILCIKDVLKYEGDTVLHWLEEIKPLFKSSIVEERIRLVMEVIDGKESYSALP